MSEENDFLVCLLLFGPELLKIFSFGPNGVRTLGT